MQNNIEIYPPFSITTLYAALAVISVTIIVIFKISSPRILKYLVLREQKKTLQSLYAKRPALIQEALQAITAIETSYSQQKMQAAEAATQLSQVVRHYFDILMNHTTLSQSKQEIAQRQLERLVSILEQSYIAEFSGNKLINLQPQLFSSAKELISACK